MITLLADSGSTKTEWALIKENEVLKFHSQGMNPYFASDVDIRKIIQDVKDWSSVSIDRIYFYGSGCNSSEKGNEVQGLFKNEFPLAHVEIYSDLVGAAKALYGNRSGVAVILGTGANSGFYNGNEIEYKTESLGFVLGDEGSGAYLGKEFIKELLYNNLSSDIENDFYIEYKTNKVEILERIYKKPYPNRYLAAFTVFMKKHENNELIRKIIKNAFESLAINHLDKYHHKTELTYGFVGSIAWHFKSILLETSNNHNIHIGSIIKQPMDNLIQHYKNK
jgi:glucosamine kinase